MVAEESSGSRHFHHLSEKGNFNLHYNLVSNEISSDLKSLKLKLKIKTRFVHILD